MGFWDAVVLIVLIVAIASVKHARHRASATAELPRPETPDAELEREVIELRKRLAVLERIATDERKGREIADEIERLRDR